MLFNELFNLSGRKALVVGGSHGLGYTAALTLSKAGAIVAVCSRSLTDSKEAAKKIEGESGNNCFGFLADVSKEKDIVSLFDTVNNEIGDIDILHCAAGINIRKPFNELSSVDWDSVMDINVKGAFLCAQQALPAMRQKKWGRIVFYGSMLSYVSIIGRAAYSSSKAALLGLTRTLALECATDCVCVNAICPGPFITPMNQTVHQAPEVQDAFVRKIPLGRWGDPAELSGILLYLSSPSCSYMTGSGIVIDGGWTAQ